MIVQKTGMVSSENPFSNTSTRYYHNPYEAKRDCPSVANTKKIVGAQERSHYLRSGEESKENPLAHGTG